MKHATVGVAGPVPDILVDVALWLFGRLDGVVVIVLLCERDCRFVCECKYPGVFAFLNPRVPRCLWVLTQASVCLCEEEEVCVCQDVSACV